MLKEPAARVSDERMALVCALPGDVLTERRAAIQATLEKRTASRFHSDGLELEFALTQEIARVLLEFVLYEQSCCKSFTYDLCFPPPHSAVTLRLRAPADQVSVLQAFYHALVAERL